MQFLEQSSKFLAPFTILTVLGDLDSQIKISPITPQIEKKKFLNKCLINALDSCLFSDRLREEEVPSPLE